MTYTPAGADYMTVFRFVSTVGFLAFGWAVVPMSIWYGHAWSATKITDTLTGKTNWESIQLTI